jgi:hypothetical protein
VARDLPHFNAHLRRAGATPRALGAALAFAPAGCRRRKAGASENGEEVSDMAKSTRKGRKVTDLALRKGQVKGGFIICRRPTSDIILCRSGK